jgi:hypothetical protein
MSDEQWNHCVEMRKQRKVGEDLEVGDGGDHKEVKGRSGDGHHWQST